MPLIDPFAGLKYGWNPATENFAADMDGNLKIAGLLLQLVVQSKTTNDPGTLAPNNGQAWIVGPAPVGAWASKVAQIAAFIDGAWLFVVPKVGWRAYIVTEDATAIYRASGWTNNPNGGGSINGGENLGAEGEGLYASVDGDKLSFKRLVSGPGVSLSSDANTVVVATDAGGASMPINTQAGSAYSLAAVDVGGAVEMTNAGANTVTIPPNTAVAFGVGTTILVRQMGTGQTTLVAGSGVSVRNPHGTLKIRGQYGSVALHKRDTDEWCVEGNLAEV